ncbi:Protein osb1, mitochondrial-like [Castilleja foliolosa]|uniref:Protein osb1, mitochondrial-like n=1 Tax=Castilleja foliolosa TaxID=1961234 RepID=A0ABD3BKK6_9LAMI
MNHFTDDSDVSDGESTVYKKALKLQRRTTVKYEDISPNFVSLIGTIVFPFRKCNCNRFGVHTAVRLNNKFSVYLKFWDEMAEMSVQHLKPNDFVYVAGCLGSYLKLDENEKTIRFYENEMIVLISKTVVWPVTSILRKLTAYFSSNYSYFQGIIRLNSSEVDVSEVNFVSRNGLEPAYQNLAMLDPEVSINEIKQKRRDRLHLWQIFFASPFEWWDDRNRKLNPKAPDFKHKDTGEVLWLNDNDPPWVHKQLQLLDSRLYRRGPGEHRNAYLSPLVYE